MSQGGLIDAAPELVIAIDAAASEEVLRLSKFPPEQSRTICAAHQKKSTLESQGSPKAFFYNLKLIFIQAEIRKILSLPILVPRRLEKVQSFKADGGHHIRLGPPNRFSKWARQWGSQLDPALVAAVRIAFCPAQRHDSMQIVAPRESARHNNSGAPLHHFRGPKTPCTIVTKENRPGFCWILHATMR